MDASEPPILDGSSKYFVEAIESVGVVEKYCKRISCGKRSSYLQ
jgi:UDP-3-O-[3-hydroxymyristoyl] N-acetylglucosamine deacetylase/3-hydroxyacyl-[acyl-carrier-protein] dehydratase